MKKLVIMVFAYDTVSFPSVQSYRVVAPDGSRATTTQGAHRATLMAHLTALLTEHGIEVDNVQQADAEGCFAMIVSAHALDDSVPLGALRQVLDRQGQSWGVSIRVQREDLFLAMHRI